MNKENAFSIMITLAVMIPIFLFSVWVIGAAIQHKNEIAYCREHAKTPDEWNR